MKKLILIFLVIIFFKQPLAAELPYYLDFKLILNESAAGKKAQTSLKKKLDSGMASLSKREKSLQEEEKKIISQKKLFQQRNIKKKLLS